MLDYIFTNEDNLVDNLQYLTPLGKSDHICLVWNYTVSVEENTSKQKKFNYWKDNYEMINAELKSYDWNEMLREERKIQWKMHGRSLKISYTKQERSVFQ